MMRCPPDVPPVTESTAWSDGSVQKAPAWVTLRDMVLRHWVPIAHVGAFLASPLSYVALAGIPAVALFVATLFMLVSFAMLVALVWPMGHYITWARRFEVLGHRAAVGATLYLVAGFGVITIVNALSERTIPLSWPEVQRFLPFWPFYTWFVVGCDTIGPCPA